MQNILANNSEGSNTKNALVLLIILAAYVVVGLFCFQIIGILVNLPFYDFDFLALMSDLQNPVGSEKAKLPLMITQAVSSIGAFILVPYFFTRIHLSFPFGKLISLPKDNGQPILMTILLVFCFMIANSALIEWNQNIEMPAFLSEFERWARAFEDKAEALTLYLTQFDSLPYFLLAIVVIAVVPAVGEELLFRGLIQNLLNKTLSNPHAAIWISAFIFSGFHFQFYGLIPRMMLGVLFGYIYYWSGSLFLAMIGHFINNAFSLTIIYLSQSGVIEMKPEDLENSLPFYVILIFLAASIFLAYLFRKYYTIQEDE